MKQLSKPLKLAAAVVALSTVFATGAYAGSQLEEIRAYLNNGLKLKIDGAAWEPKLSDGTPIRPITYDGSTYLPVRAVSEALNVAVNYDEATDTVLLGERSEGVPISAEKYDLWLFSQTREPSKTSYNGVEYKELFHTTAINGLPNITLNPNKKYQKLVLEIGATEDSFEVVVTSGDVELAAKKLTKADGLTKMEVDIGGAEKVKVEIKAPPLNKGAAIILPTSYYK